MTTLERQRLISAITTAIENVFDGENKSEVEQQDKPTEMLTIHGLPRQLKDCPSIPSASSLLKEKYRRSERARA